MILTETSMHYTAFSAACLMLDNAFFFTCSSSCSMRLQLCDPTNWQETLNSLIVSPAQFSVLDGVRRWCEVWNQHSRTQHNVVIVQFKKPSSCLCVRVCWLCARGRGCVKLFATFPIPSNGCRVFGGVTCEWHLCCWWFDGRCIRSWVISPASCVRLTGQLFRANSRVERHFYVWTQGFSKPALFYSYIGQIHDW